MPPVENHPVHEHGVRRGDFKAGCFDRTLCSDGYWAKDGFDMQTDPVSGVTYSIQKMTWVDHTMSKSCRQITPLVECEGCIAPKDYEYINKMRNL